MKKIIYAILPLLLVACFNTNDDKHYSLVGAWELIDASYKPAGRHLKLYIDHHFTTIWQSTEDNPSNIYPGFNGGIYKLKKNDYTEYHYLNHNEENIGKTSYFVIDFEKDTFIIYQLDEVLRKTEFFEKWKRSDL